MDFAAPTGYLAYGNIAHVMQREKLCDMCRKPLTTVNPTQKRHLGACAQKSRRLAIARARIPRVANNQEKYGAKPSSLTGTRYRSGQWEARTCKGGVSRSLGTFDTEEEAARAYDAAVLNIAGGRPGRKKVQETEAA